MGFAVRTTYLQHARSDLLQDFKPWQAFLLRPLRELVKPARNANGIKMLPLNGKNRCSIN